MLITTVVILIGGAVQIIPTLLVKSNVPTLSSVKPYTPLEIEGRDLYIREGCVSCHSQMIRPFRSEVARYGTYSRGGEYVYDHPFLWGSKRTGPDLLRVGKKYSDSWHFNHFHDPQATSPGSIMPRYPWLIQNKLDTSELKNKMEVMASLGVPYTKDEIINAQNLLLEQALQIEQNLYEDQQIQSVFKNTTVTPLHQREVIALIAYLQRLGTDISQAQLETITKSN
jgi:cytochrome c oxidase cbb3-type subunit I/II